MWALSLDSTIPFPFPSHKKDQVDRERKIFMFKIRAQWCHWVKESKEKIQINIKFCSHA